MRCKDWQPLKWGDIATLEYGKSLKGYKCNEGEVPVFGTNGRIGFTDKPLCNSEGVIVGRKGAYRGVHYSKVPFFVIDTAFYLKPLKQGLFDVQWAYYELLTKRINDLDSGSAIPSTSRGDFYALPVLVPPPTEQRAIANILSALDNKIEQNSRINHHLEQMVQAIYKSWFVDFEPWDGVMPEDWRLVKLGRLCQSISKTHAFDKDKLIFLNTGDIDKGQFLHSNYSQVSALPGQAKKSICCGDILYSEIRPINKHYAYVGFDAPDYVVSTKLMVIRTDGIDSRRLYHYLTSPDVLTELQLEAESRSGTFPQIRFENIQQLEIVLASPEVERNFTALLHDVYAKIDANVAESKRLAELRGTLLPLLISGELSVADI
nr:restriction endonuclease subunit S [uncultured Anaeromusa sp.]